MARTRHLPDEHVHFTWDTGNEPRVVVDSGDIPLEPSRTKGIRRPIPGGGARPGADRHRPRFGSLAEFAFQALAEWGGR
jgi:hypothetical protein